MNDPSVGVRRVLLVTHTGREDIADRAATVVSELRRCGFTVLTLDNESIELGLSDVVPVPVTAACDGVEMVLTLGGDGTFLRGGELARSFGVPLLGINLGQMGFLAEAELDGFAEVAQRIASKDYDVEERMTVDVVVEHDGAVVATDWALNEATVEKGEPARMLEVLIEVDDRKLSRYGCDGVVCATPSGSTAHAMSAGGPVVWPQVSALLLVPISAHALFSRPLVIAPTSKISVTVEPYAPAAVLTCDGRRGRDVLPGSVVKLCRGSHPIRSVRLTDRPFTDRLVAKLALPVEGWRGHRIG